MATDHAPQMLAIAQERADALGLANLELREMDAEALDLPENTFDAILCRWGLMFLRTSDVRSEHLVVTMEWPSAEEYITFLRDIAPIIPILASYSAEKQAQAWQAIKEAVQHYATADGAVTMPNEAICVVGRRG